MDYHSCPVHRRYQYLLLTYILCTALFSVSLFMYGFFSMKIPSHSAANMDNIPEYIDGVKQDKNTLYKPSVNKVVLMVIDALRWDFVKDAHKLNTMPKTNSAIQNNTACLLQVKVNAPTVTMPRIKAMTTGMMPNFVDVILNFGKSSIQSDSLLHQAKKQGHKIIFYGDDTWLKLYPDTFFRYEGTTSFFVSDFTEVDNNVTRHIDEELHRDDWSVMILHYLGLDHIGHVYGPRSPLIKPKLNEMDEIIHKINMKIKEWNNNGIPSLLIVCGDHGMKDSGGHGGATPEETLVPFVAFGASCPVSHSHSHSHKIEQIDIATTLAMLLGVPIPSSNLGTISLNMIQKLPAANNLFMLYYNAIQIYSHFEKLTDYKLTETYSKYVKVMKLHSDLLRLSETEKKIEQSNYVIDMYYNVLQEMKRTLVKSAIKYNLSIMVISMILIIQILIIMINPRITRNFSTKIFIGSLTTSLVLWILWIRILDNHNSEDIIADLKDLSLELLFAILAVIAVNCYIFSRSLLSIAANVLNQIKSLNIFTISQFIYVSSLTSSSFIEEEHQTWYFFWTTFLIHIIYTKAKDLKIFSSTKLINENFVSILKAILLILGHRILRKMNSTGDKYAHLPDIKGWLENRESNIELSLILIIALGTLITIGFIYEDQRYKSRTLIFYSIMGLCIYQRHASAKDVAQVQYFSFESQGIVEVGVFWIVIVCFILYHMQRFFYSENEKINQRISKRLIFLIMQLWVMVSALLHRPHNVILLPLQILTCTIIYNLIEPNENQTYISYWIGNIFYFYQGNSNSLATINVAAGYVGLKTYRPIVATIFLCVNTFSAIILAYLMLIFIILNEKKLDQFSYQKILSINQQCIMLRFFPLAFYSIFVSIQRYHLFVWTVFSPKLLYQAAHCAIFFFIVFIVQIIFWLEKNKTKYRYHKYQTT